MEVRLLDPEYVRDGWLANQLAGFWKDFARETDGRAYPPMAGQVVPAADVVEDPEGYHFSFEMPGLKSDSLDVRVEEGRLVIEAERTRPEWPKEAQVHLSERMYGQIRRSFRIPEDAGHDAISASYHDGVLTVKVPKRPDSKPVRIKVNNG